MGIFNHVIRYSEILNPELDENCVSIVIDYDDAFGARRSVQVPYNDPHNKQFDISRVKITGRAITGSVLRPTLVIAVLSPHEVKVLRKDGATTHEWIDDTLPQVGDQAHLVESFHPKTGEMTLLVTGKGCDSPGLMSMNVIILDVSMDMDNPARIEYVNLFTGEIF